MAHRVPIGSKVALFKSIGGIKLGMTPKAVVRKLGKPPHPQRVNGKITELSYHGSLFAMFAVFNGRDQCYMVTGIGKRLHTPGGHPPRELARVAQARL